MGGHMAGVWFACMAARLCLRPQPPLHAPEVGPDVCRDAHERLQPRGVEDEQ